MPDLPVLMFLDDIAKKYGDAWAGAAFLGLIFAGAIVLMFCVMALGRRNHHRRKLRRQDWGEKHGLRLLDTPDMGRNLLSYVDTDIGAKVLQDYPYAVLFQNRTAPMAMHILEGQVDGLLARTFEFRYITGSGKHMMEHQFTVIAFHFDVVKPYTALQRHGWLDGLSKQDIHTGRKELDDAFYIYADDWRLLSNELPDDLAKMIMESRLSEFVLADRTLIVAARGRMKDSGYDELFADARRLANWFASKR